MDWLARLENAKQTMKKYRYLVIVLVVGLFLMLLPQKEPQSVIVSAPIQPEEDLATQLESILCELEGAGKVKVLLTQAAGERSIFQTNESSDTSDTGSAVRRDTVIITDSGRTESGLLQQTIAPVYLGAVILCQGADRATVRLAIIEAVSSATGLTSTNISVLKMK